MQQATWADSRVSGRTSGIDTALSSILADSCVKFLIITARHEVQGHEEPQAGKRSHKYSLILQ